MSFSVSPAQAAHELLRRRRGRESLTGFSGAVAIPGRPDEAVEHGIAAHHRLLMEAIDTCLDTANGRLMVFMPPGSAKSTYASVLTPPFAMGRKPGFRVIGACYASELARKLGRRCRSIVRQPAFERLFGTRLSLSLIHI